MEGSLFFNGVEVCWMKMGNQKKKGENKPFLRKTYCTKSKNKHLWMLW